MLKIYIGNALPIGVKIIGGLFLLRAFAAHLGQEGLGLASQYQSVITLSYGLFNALIFNYAVKHQWTDDESSNSFTAFLVWVLKASLALAVGIGLLAWPLSSLIFNDSAYVVYIVYAALQIPFVAVYIGLSAKMCAEKKQIKYNLIVAASAFVAMIAVWCSAMYLNIDSVLISLAFFYVPAFLLQAYVSRQELMVIHSKWHKVKKSFDCQPVLRFSLVAVVSAFLAVVVQMVVRKIILDKSGWAIVGEWQVVNKISESYLLLASIPLFTFFLPRYAAQKKWKAKKALLIKIASISVIVVCTTGGLIYTLWNDIANLIIGSQFLELKPIFGMQVIGDIFKIWAWVLVTAALGDNFLKLVLVVEILFAIFYCSLIYALFPAMGLEGAVTSYGVAYLVVALVLSFFYHHQYNEK